MAVAALRCLALFMSPPDLTNDINSTNEQNNNTTTITSPTYIYIYIYIYIYTGAASAGHAAAAEATPGARETGEEGG